MELFGTAWDGYNADEKQLKAKNSFKDSIGNLVRDGVFLHLLVLVCLNVFFCVCFLFLLSGSLIYGY